MSAQQGHIVPVKPTPIDAQIIPPPVPASEMSDAELGAEAARAVERHIAMREGAVESAIRAGELLREARGRCDRDGRSWRDWLTRNWPKSRQTAQRYMALALEVQQISGPRAGRNLLGLPSIRAALTEADYDAGGAKDSSDPEGQEARDEARMEQLVADAAEEKAPQPPAVKSEWRAPPRGGLASNSGATTSPGEIARRAEARAMAQRERQAIEDAKNRPPLVKCPPENPHQVGHKKTEGAGDVHDIPCHAQEINDLADRSADLHHRATLLAAEARRVTTALWTAESINVVERDRLMAEFVGGVEVVEVAASALVKKFAPGARKAAALDSAIVGAERERLHKNQKSSKRSAS